MYINNSLSIAAIFSSRRLKRLGLRRQEKSYGKSSGKGWGKSSYDSYGGRWEEIVGKAGGENVPMAAEKNWVQWSNPLNKQVVGTGIMMSKFRGP